MKTKRVKFVQFGFSRTFSALHALDDEGQIWIKENNLDNDSKGWRLISSPEVEDTSVPKK